MPNVILFRDRLLPLSETFILQQAESVCGYTPIYAGSRRISGIDTPPDRTVTLNGGTLPGYIAEMFFKLNGTLLRPFRDLADRHPVLLHAHFGPDGVLAIPLAHQLRIPMVVTFHGYDATARDEAFRTGAGFKHRLYLKHRDRLKQQAKLFLAVSDFIRRRLIEQGFPAEKIVRHYIGVNTDQFQPDPTVTREPLVLFVGRLVEKKGCEYLIRAMHVVQRDLPEAQVTIIGEGPLRPELEELAAHCLKNYRFVGGQTADQVKNWLNRASVFSVPSITATNGDAEGLGIVFLEAAAMGVPVVSFASGGIPEAVLDGETGLLAPERDWQMLSAHIKRLLADTQLRARLSGQGTQRVRKEFDLKVQSRALADLYSLVIRDQTP